MLIFGQQWFWLIFVEFWSFLINLWAKSVKTDFYQVLSICCAKLIFPWFFNQNLFLLNFGQNWFFLSRFLIIIDFDLFLDEMCFYRFIDKIFEFCQFLETIGFPLFQNKLLLIFLVICQFQVEINFFIICFFSLRNSNWFIFGENWFFPDFWELKIKICFFHKIEIDQRLLVEIKFLSIFGRKLFLSIFGGRNRLFFFFNFSKQIPVFFWINFDFCWFLSKIELYRFVGVYRFILSKG